LLANVDDELLLLLLLALLLLLLLLVLLLPFVLPWLPLVVMALDSPLVDGSVGE
jgi:hypothetical protein